MPVDEAEKTFVDSLVKLSDAKVDLTDSTLEAPLGPLQIDTPDMESPVRVAGNKREPITLKNIFRNHDTHPILMDIYLTDHYGPVWVTWDPDSLWIIIERDFKTSIANLTKDKINAVKTLHMVDSYWDDWEIFEKVTQALNNNIPRFDISQPPTIGQMLNSVSIAKQTRPDMEFSEEVGQYVSAMADEEGVEYLPPPLTFGQKYLGPAPQDVVQRVKELSKIDWKNANLKEVPADVQALRILIGQAYSQFRKDSLKAQLPILKS